MFRDIHIRRLFVCILIQTHLVTCQIICAQTTTNALLGSTSAPKGTREFAASNPDDAETIRVEVWGDLSNPGVYSIPDVTTLRAMIGFVGGPQASPPRTDLTLSRIGKSGNRRGVAMTYRLTAEDLLTSTKWANYKLQEGDVIHLEGKEVPQESKTSFFDVLRDLMFIMGFMTTTVTTIFVLQKL